MIKKIRSKFRLHKHKFVENILPKYFYKSGFLASLYYAFFSSAFQREHRAVLSGKVNHQKENGKFYLLVRNIHRLEKGLLMRPRRNTFGMRYISETVDAFCRLSKSESFNSHREQFQWFGDVLNEYFTVVTLNSQLMALKNKFEKQNHSSLKHPLKIPYNRRQKDFSKISFEEFYLLTKQRRSVRWFEKRKVPRELIDKALLAANQSPSACNRQPFEYFIIDDPKFLKTAVKLPMGTAGYDHSIPMLVIAVGNLDAYFSERDRHLIYIDTSLANMAFMLALETLGLSSCPINWPDIEGREQAMSEFLQLKKYQRPIMCIGVGYPDAQGMVAFSEKRQIENLRKYNI